MHRSGRVFLYSDASNCNEWRQSSGTHVSDGNTPRTVGNDRPRCGIARSQGSHRPPLQHVLHSKPKEQTMKIQLTYDRPTDLNTDLLVVILDSDTTFHNLSGS